MSPRKPQYIQILLYNIVKLYEGWNFNSGNYLLVFTTDAK